LRVASIMMGRGYLPLGSSSAAPDKPTIQFSTILISLAGCMRSEGLVTGIGIAGINIFIDNNGDFLSIVSNEVID
jgi:hypothetical protein